MVYDTTLKTLIERKFASFVSPLEAFIYRQTTASILLVILAGASLILANTPWHDNIDAAINTGFGFTLGERSFSLSLNLIFNDEGYLPSSRSYQGQEIQT